MAIKLIETVTKKTGESNIIEKKFSTMKQLKKALDSCPISAFNSYEVMRKKKTTIQYEDATVVIERFDGDK
jgi:hypothetical protein